MAATQQKIRNIVWTGGIAMVTATGAWYGAGLKMKGEMKKVCPTYPITVSHSPPLSEAEQFDMWILSMC